MYYINQQCFISEKLILFTFLLALSFSLISADNIVLFYLSLEAFSFVLYMLAVINNTIGAIIGGIRYFLFGTFGSILMLSGLVSIVLNLTSGTSVDFSYYLDLFNNGGNFGLQTEFGLSLMLLGLIVKIGAAPFHNWVVDVYPSVSFDINFLYSIFVKLVLVGLIYKFSPFSFVNSNIEIIAVLSIIIGSVGALQQTEIRKFLAYSSVAHTGLILCADQFAV